MYSIYVTNKTRKNVYIRLQRQAISSSNESFHRELDKLTAGNDDDDVYTKSCVNSYLVRWGFFIIPAQETMAFAAEGASDEARMYASLYARGKLWIMDYEVNCVRYGCMFVLRKNDGKSTYPPGFPKTFKEPAKWLFYLSQANPEPVWIPTEVTEASQGKLNESAIKAGFDTVEGDLYFGRSSCYNGTKPCKVIIKAAESVLYSWYTIVHGEKQERGELLKDTGHTFVRASRGDPVPPNAVICGVTDPEGALYLGRVGGNTPCAVSTESGRIKYFCFYAGEVKQVESGEIMVLTK